MTMADVARTMAVPQVELLLRRQSVRDAELGLLTLRVNTVSARGDERAMRDAINDLFRQAGYEASDTPFKRLLAKAKPKKSKN